MLGHVLVTAEAAGTVGQIGEVGRVTITAVRVPFDGMSCFLDLARMTGVARRYCKTVGLVAIGAALVGFSGLRL